MNQNQPAPQQPLAGKRVAVIVESQFIPQELDIYRQRFQSYGATVDFVSHLWGQPKQRFYSTVEPGVVDELQWLEVGIEVDDVKPSDYAAIIAVANYATVRLRSVSDPPPGADPHELARNAPAVRFFREAMLDRRIVKGAPCHALWLLTPTPEVLRGRRVVCNTVVLADVLNAGAEYVPFEPGTPQLRASFGGRRSRHQHRLARHRTPRRHHQGHHRPKTAGRARTSRSDAMTLSAAPTLPDIEVQPRHPAASPNTVAVQFVYHTGIAQDLFSNVRLCGSWDDSGLPSTAWTTTPMQQHTGIDGCPTYTATIEFPDTQVGAVYSWGVIADSGSGRDLWAIPTEVPDPDSAARQRTFTLAPDPSRTALLAFHQPTARRQPALDPRRRPTHPIRGVGAQRTTGFGRLRRPRGRLHHRRRHWGYRAAHRDAARRRRGVGNRPDRSAAVRASSASTTAPTCSGSSRMTAASPTAPTCTPAAKSGAAPLIRPTWPQAKPSRGGARTSTAVSAARWWSTRNG